MKGTVWCCVWLAVFVAASRAEPLKNPDGMAGNVSTTAQPGNLTTTTEEPTAKLKRNSGHLTDDNGRNDSPAKLEGPPQIESVPIQFIHFIKSWHMISSIDRTIELKWRDFYNKYYRPCKRVKSIFIVFYWMNSDKEELHSRFRPIVQTWRLIRAAAQSARLRVPFVIRVHRLLLHRTKDLYRRHRLLTSPVNFSILSLANTFEQCSTFTLFSTRPLVVPCWCRRPTVSFIHHIQWIRF